ncbi:MAG: hypothetical protein P8N11_08740 [Gammaproteobacteria bacterium]|jgi:hypothetical protein|nr:hypothetical protein [Gammaproteobacteria bacterium]
MKKLLIILTIFLLPFQSQASGIYDGIWQFPAGIFATVNQNGSSLAVIILQNTIWEAQLGTLVGNRATIATVYGYVSATIEIVFNSPTSAAVTIISCINGPTEACLFPAGTQLIGTKIF